MRCAREGPSSIEQFLVRREVRLEIATVVQGSMHWFPRCLSPGFVGIRVVVARDVDGMLMFWVCDFVSLPPARGVFVSKSSISIRLLPFATRDRKLILSPPVCSALMSGFISGGASASMCGLFPGVKVSVGAGSCLIGSNSGCCVFFGTPPGLPPITLSLRCFFFAGGWVSVDGWSFRLPVCDIRSWWSSRRLRFHGWVETRGVWTSIRCGREQLPLGVPRFLLRGRVSTLL